jgi:hypothetical protein
MKGGNFDSHVWNEIKKKMLKGVGNNNENRDFYEMLIYSMDSISEIFGTGIMQYNESQLQDRLKNAGITPPFYEVDKEFLFNLDFFARFLTI